MERHGVHALTAAYALDALDEADEREYETHLRTCESCRADLAELTDVATSLAYAVDAPPPPPALRERILASAREERAVVVPFRSRRAPLYALGTLAAAAAAVAIGLGLWGSSLSDRVDQLEATSAILGDPDAQSHRLTGADGHVVVSDTGDAVLVVQGLDRAPSGKTYEAWVIEGDEPRPAGTFDAGQGRDLIRLREQVPPGATVAVTVERDGGVGSPTGTPIITATT